MTHFAGLLLSYLLFLLCIFYHNYSLVWLNYLRKFAIPALIPTLKVEDFWRIRLKFGKLRHSQNQSFTYMSIQTYMFLYLYLFSESILFTSISFKDCSVKKSMKNFWNLFLREFFLKLIGNSTWYEAECFIFHFPVADTQKRLPISWKSQIAVGGGARIWTADTAGMNRML